MWTVSDGTAVHTQCLDEDHLKEKPSNYLKKTKKFNT